MRHETSKHNFTEKPSFRAKTYRIREHKLLRTEKMLQMFNLNRGGYENKRFERILLCVTKFKRRGLLGSQKLPNLKSANAKR